MLSRQLLAVLLACVFSAAAISDSSIPGLLAEKGELIFADDFGRSDLGNGQVIMSGNRS